MFGLQKPLERYCNNLPVFASTSANDDLNWIKSKLLPNLVVERDFDPKVLKKANQFLLCQLLETLNIFESATINDSFSKSNKTSENKEFSPTKGSISTKLRKSKAQNFQRVRDYTIKFVTVSLLRKIKVIMLTYRKVERLTKKLFLKGNYQSEYLLGLRTINTCNKLETRN